MSKCVVKKESVPDTLNVIYESPDLAGGRWSEKIKDEQSWLPPRALFVYNWWFWASAISCFQLLQLNLPSAQEETDVNWNALERSSSLWFPGSKLLQEERRRKPLMTTFEEQGDFPLRNHCNCISPSFCMSHSYASRDLECDNILASPARSMVLTRGSTATIRIAFFVAG